ncbi:hypothetical protein UGMREWDR_CDS0180 [Aeromonas phage GomatiRiver_11]|nr:hypothetical protein UGMREWDR_CDS0180 [Aeromonas phage GomatiRiver_11]
MRIKDLIFLSGPRHYEAHLRNGQEFQCSGG